LPFDAPLTPRDSDICLILFAVYHATDNIASQRFKGLLRFLDTERVKATVITLPPPPTAPELGEGVHFVDGKTHVQASWPDVTETAKTLFGLGTPRRAAKGAQYYMKEAAAQAIVIGRAAKAAGQRVVMMGTYDPLDALVAAHRAARVVGAPLVLDFRDGYAHDNLVPASPQLHRLRGLIEGQLVRRAAAIIGVTRPLCDDFRRRYPRKPVFLLPNGFMPHLHFSSGQPAHVPVTRPVRLGHFGRIGHSDKSSFATFAAICAQLGALPADQRNAFALTFMGHLRQDESAMAQGLGDHVRLIPEQPATDAAHAMREMDALLLVTGSRATTATGKFYQYLASGKRIVLVSRVENEASRTLRDIGDDDVIHILGDAPLDFTALAAKLRQPFRRNQAAIAGYAKNVQAWDLLTILNSVLR
jgi:Glycosyl transferase 4-like domain